MFIAVWLNWQCTVIRGRLQGLLVADRIRRSKVEEWAERLYNEETLIQQWLLQRERRGRFFYVFNRQKSYGILLFSSFFVSFLLYSLTCSCIGIM